MSNLNLREKEWKLIKEYQRNQNENIALYFYQKYGDDVCNVVFYKISSKFSSVPLERNDLLSFVWKGIKNTLDTVKVESKDRLKSCFIRQTYNKSLREALKFLSNGHIILNNASSLEGLIEQNTNLKTKNGVVYQEVKYELLRDELIKKITTKIQGYDQVIIQRIIYLKSLGYSIREIARKMNLTERVVRNLYHVIIRIGKIIYRN